MERESVVAGSGVRWREVGLFVGLTFALTWLLDLALALTTGLNNPATGIVLQAQMLLPAFSAIALGMFVFTGGGPLNLRVGRQRSRWFFYYFLAYTVLYLVLAGAAIASPDQIQLLGTVGLAATVLGLLLAVVLRLTGRREDFARVGLGWGRARYWVGLGIGFLLFYALQAWLNYTFALGQPVDLTPLALQTGIPADTLLPVLAVQIILVGPFLGLLIAFGEEYGWRGYLQAELTKMGRARGILVLGIIWGVWHTPVILMGYNYPGYPVVGSLLMVGYTVGLAFVLGYAVLKTGSVWLAAFLHALNNQTLNFFAGMVYAPNDPVFSFGAGLYGLAIMAVVVLLLLRDPVWKKAG